MKSRKKVGRPRLDYSQRCVYLSDRQIEDLKVIGRGSVSAGIRYVIEQHLIKLP